MGKNWGTRSCFFYHLTLKSKGVWTNKLSSQRPGDGELYSRHWDPAREMRDSERLTSTLISTRQSHLHNSRSEPICSKPPFFFPTLLLPSSMKRVFSEVCRQNNRRAGSLSGVSDSNGSPSLDQCGLREACLYGRHPVLNAFWNLQNSALKHTFKFCLKYYRVKTPYMFFISSGEAVQLTQSWLIWS